MKLSKSLLFIPTVVFVMACQNSPTPKTAATSAMHEHLEEDDHLSNGQLTLNNGAKWKADKSTNEHAAVLEKLANDFTAINTPDIKTGKDFSANVEKETASLVSACKMTGDDHEKLHIWLAGVLHDVDMVKQATDQKSVEIAGTRLASSILSYHQYFE